MPLIRLLLFTLLFAMPLDAAAEMADFTAYQRLLTHHVSSGQVNGIQLNTVDYAAWAGDPDYPSAINALAGFDPKRLSSREETLAFWINTYNLLAIHLVIDNRVKHSIKDAGSWYKPVWDLTAGRVGGKGITLNTVEHEILRPMGEPRIHLAIVCASLSCPDLRPEAYTAKQLYSQLADQTHKFLSNPTKGLKAEHGELTVSMIFDWFEEDFEKVGGVLEFTRQHAPNLPAGARINNHFEYDWSLNRP